MRRAFLLLLLAGCRAEDPEPPDPDRPMPPVVCGPDVPLGFAAAEPDSGLDVPPWLRYCALCPPGRIEIDYGEGPSARTLASGWSVDGTCAYAMPEAAPPDADTAVVGVTLSADDRVGSFDFDVPLPPRGLDPSDLGTATWILPLTDALVHPALPIDVLPDLWLRWDPLTGAAVLGAGDTAVPGTQDACAPTTALTAPLALDRRVLAGPIASGQALPLPWSQAVRRGALQARMSSTGSALSDVALLVVFDASLLEAATGVPAQDTCDAAEAAAGMPVCGQCDPPDADPLGFPACWTAVWEWPVALRAAAPLLDVAPGACAG